MAKTTISFECPDFYDLYMTCHAHGWKSLSPFSWYHDKHTLRFAALVENQPIDIEVQQSTGTIKAVLTSHQKLDRTSKNSAKSILWRSLGLDIDISDLLTAAQEIGPDYVKLIKNGAGRLLRAPAHGFLQRRSVRQHALILSHSRPLHENSLSLRQTASLNTAQTNSNKCYLLGIELAT